MQQAKAQADTPLPLVTLDAVFAATNEWRVLSFFLFPKLSTPLSLSRARACSCFATDRGKCPGASDRADNPVCFLENGSKTSYFDDIAFDDVGDAIHRHQTSVPRVLSTPDLFQKTSCVARVVFHIPLPV